MNEENIDSYGKITDLTLTSVVFEFRMVRKDGKARGDLTLTSVVFESPLSIISLLPLFNLTLTSVVFECFLKLDYDNECLFNFNKCCI